MALPGDEYNAGVLVVIVAVIVMKMFKIKKWKGLGVFWWKFVNFLSREFVSILAEVIFFF